MKRLLAIAMAGMLGLSLVGCHASAGIDPDSDHDTDTRTSYKKTTTYDRDGDTVRTEVKTERR